METPSSTRRVTRSQALIASNNSSSSSNNIPVSRKIEESEKNHSKTRERNNGQQQDRCAMMDITNDSPIVGLANNGHLETPLSSMAKQRGSRMKKTPGSGEALLRGQVKTLLQKVEEEAVLSKISLETRPFLKLMNSPMGLIAPTPANTPQIANLSSGSITLSPIVQEQLITQVVNHLFDGKKNEEESESEKSVITRSLLLDFSEKSEISDASECFSEVSYQEVVVVRGGGGEKSSSATIEDDDSSVWSIQVNASSTQDEDDDEGEIAEDEEDYYDDDDVEVEEEEEEDDGGLMLDELCEEDYYDDDDDVEVEEEEEEDDGGLMLDELCEGLNNISVDERVAPKFEGKHTRFVYNSDDELVKEEVENCSASASSNVLRLKGMPTPKGKHLRFSEEEEGQE